jgi:hypothetical protein
MTKIFDMPKGSVSHWSCSICRSENKQRFCCGFGTCEHSTFAQKSIEQMWEHLINVHGFKKPKGWDDDKRVQKNKAKARRKKDKKKKRRK